MPALTIGILALAAIVLGLAIWINGLGGSDDGGPSPAQILQTQTALQTLEARTPQSTVAPTGAPGTTTPSAGTPATTQTTGATPSPTRGKTYTIVDGDTCSTIASKTNVTLEALLLANNLDDNSCRLLEVGRTLTIP